MSTSILSDFDTHIESLRSQWSFLVQTLDATDAETPSWLAKDLIILRNQTNKLQTNMERVRVQLGDGSAGSKRGDGGLREAQADGTNDFGRNGYASDNERRVLHGTKRKASSERVKSPKRLSLTNGNEISKETEPELQGQEPTSSIPLPSNGDNAHSPTDPTASEQPEQEEEPLVQYEDITQEVQKRLREKRIQDLMDSPASAKKRKHAEFEYDGAGNTEQSETERSEAPSECRSPVKKLRLQGQMDQSLKRKETGLARGDVDERAGEPDNRKRVKR
ncbi:hypothetical protein K469DRAFT_712997 [Zopfia rhizophila CBS 207.26]|uniref:Uncharacterized protein n=1 Tax=Zopfia rhizophila CBS 207.26 TaxID=1314779 RepID=A0A6A6DQQ1_9PEZI|nr:hypothetical protein K469DRAFT_712997 [Zopfia rhizophila CBS 207.26]